MAFRMGKDLKGESSSPLGPKINIPDIENFPEPAELIQAKKQTDEAEKQTKYGKLTFWFTLAIAGMTLVILLLTLFLVLKEFGVI